MKCPNCNFEVAENTKFCPECGTKIPEMTAEATSSSEIIDETSNAPSTKEANEQKKVKKKKIKKIIIISVSALLACGIIFLVLRLINPFCMFGHNTSRTNCVEPTCGAEGYYEYSCSNCEYIDKYPISNRDIEHKWDDIPCGEENTCLICGEKEILNHSYESVEPICVHCGKELYTINLPTMPQTINEIDYSGKTESSVVIKNAEISMFTPSISNEVYICFDVQKIYDEDGNKNSSYGIIGWKLYDSKGKVVDSGTGYSEGQLCVGETAELWISFSYLDVWGEYRLELLDIQ